MKPVNKTFMKMTLVSTLLFVLFSARSALAWPSDPPSAGDWPSGVNYDVPYRRSGVSQNASTKAVKIYNTNPNFVPNHACDSSGNKISHFHLWKDYDDDFGGTDGTVSVTEGNDYWDWFYENYSPAPTREADCTTVTNCTCYAYDEYKGSSTQANYWVNSDSDSQKYKDEIYTIRSSGLDNTDFDTIPGDRCHHTDHVWKIVSSTFTCPARKIRWKAGTSGVYTWDHDNIVPTWTNDCPKSENATQLFESNYAVLNKDDR